MKKIRAFFALIFSVIVGACATQDAKYQQEKLLGEWEAKAQIKNLDSGEAHQVSLDFLAEKAERYRLEVTGSLGVHVASFVLNKDEFSYVVYPDKKFFIGSSKKGHLQRLAGMPLAPEALFNIFFDEAFVGKQWKCENDQRGLLSACIDSAQKMKILWTERVGERKRITISNPHREVQILIKDFNPRPQVDPNRFSLKEIIESYKSN